MKAFVAFTLIFTCNGLNLFSSDVACPDQCICLSSTHILCHGTKLTQIPEDMPSGVNHLSFTRNQIQEIRGDTLSRYKCLNKLYLDGNPITSIRPFAFKDLPRLEEISVQNTPLERLPNFAFAGLNNVTNVFLSHNRIKRIEGYVFTGSSNIQNILLTRNPVYRIESSAFSGLSEVRMLFLPSGIRVLDSGAFKGLSAVDHLKLEHLDLTNLRPQTFTGLRSVKLLTIQESDLGIVRPDAFAGMVDVDELHILNNKIDQVAGLRIDASNKVGTLRIVGNHFLETPSTISIKISEVRKLVVEKNYFPCDCRLFWLFPSDLVSSQDDFMNSNFCLSPFEMHGKLISGFNVNQVEPCVDLGALHQQNLLTTVFADKSELTSKVSYLSLDFKFYLFAILFSFFTL
ncbi:insulin-like growth factor-binding protein complex acid labile subunit isoform X2 [Artemia franciscana]|uniref:insulin-like growth factor-binding protein complex acid labile subunit isoform X2 n=1 Tax=Artemia franciscana TaxID=6661 RepID=UPI0032DAEB73